MEETKIDKVLSAVLTIQGQVTILQGQVTTLQGQMKTTQDQIKVMQDQMKTTQDQMKVMQDQIATIDEKIDKKLDEKFAQFKKDLGPLLKGTLDEMQCKTAQNTETIQKLPCISLKSKLRKFVSKTN